MGGPHSPKENLQNCHWSSISNSRGKMCKAFGCLVSPVDIIALPLNLLLLIRQVAAILQSEPPLKWHSEVALLGPGD